MTFAERLMVLGLGYPYQLLLSHAHFFSGALQPHNKAIIQSQSGLQFQAPMTFGKG